MLLTPHKISAVQQRPKSKSRSVTGPSDVPDEVPNGLDDIGADSLVALLARAPWLAKILPALGE